MFFDYEKDFNWNSNFSLILIFFALYIFKSDYSYNNYKVCSFIQSIETMAFWRWPDTQEEIDMYFNCDNEYLKQYFLNINDYCKTNNLEGKIIERELFGKINLCNPPTEVNRKFFKEFIDNTNTECSKKYNMPRTCVDLKNWEGANEVLN